MKSWYLYFGSLGLCIFSEEKFYLATLQKRQRKRIIDNLQLLPEATLAWLDINPSFVIDSQLTALQHFLHKLTVALRLFESSLTGSHMLQKQLAVPLFANRSYGSRFDNFYEHFVNLFILKVVVCHGVQLLTSFTKDQKGGLIEVVTRTGYELWLFEGEKVVRVVGADQDIIGLFDRLHTCFFVYYNRKQLTTNHQPLSV